MLPLGWILDDTVTLTKVLEKMDYVSFARIRMTNTHFRNHFINYKRLYALPVDAELELRIRQTEKGPEPSVTIIHSSKRLEFIKGTDGAPGQWRYMPARTFNLPVDYSPSLCGYSFKSINLEFDVDPDADTLAKLLRIYFSFKRVRQFRLPRAGSFLVRILGKECYPQAIATMGRMPNFRDIVLLDIPRVSFCSTSSPSDLFDSPPELVRLLRGKEDSSFKASVDSDTNVLKFLVQLTVAWSNGTMPALKRLSVELETRVLTSDGTFPGFLDAPNVRWILKEAMKGRKQQLPEDTITRRDIFLVQSLQSAAHLAVLILDSFDTPTGPLKETFHFQVMENPATELPPLLSVYYSEYPVDFSPMSQGLERCATDLKELDCRFFESYKFIERNYGKKKRSGR